MPLLRSAPIISTSFPPVIGPVSGWIDSIMGLLGGSLYLKPLGSLKLPRSFIFIITTSFSPSEFTGVSAEILVELSTFTTSASTPPIKNLTPSGSVLKPVPVTAIFSPPSV